MQQAAGPSDITLEAPFDNAKLKTSPVTLSAKSPTTGYDYEFSWSTASDFSGVVNVQPVAGVPAGTSATAALGGLSQGVTYYWRVRGTADAGANWTDYSQTRSFTLDSAL